jgi:hypothetical protein
MKHKTKHLKNVILRKSFLAALIICGLSAYLPLTTSKVEAKISYSKYVRQLPGKACDNLRGSDAQFKEQCDASYKKGAADVYFSGKSYAASQQAKLCAASTDFTCTAYSAGMGDGITILNQSGGSGDSNPTKKPGDSGGNQPSGSSNPVPPISECSKAGSKADINKCKNDYHDCNGRLGPINHVSIADCKRQVINDAKNKKKDDEKPKKKTKPKENEIAGNIDGTHQCGNLPDEGDNYKTKFDFGCLGTSGPDGLGPIQDLLFAFIRFASVGVGIVVTLAVIAAGIQYSMAEGNPESSHKAKVRAREALIGLMIYIFAFSLLQFLIPGGMFT